MNAQPHQVRGERALAGAVDALDRDQHGAQFTVGRSSPSSSGGAPLVGPRLESSAGIPEVSFGG